ncbi:MTAP family purine nucleoside phosphorylase [Arthrobacter bambusae]|uniref:MTAP family purine nucleoside phosphorylase n=1 Tax=Arthrobacter bambusae TaxID=1338426 RepID=UPI00277D202F|nr:MTAP family purine nucleoside phosphorylase [Arthrobacter bambusae]MDQ0210320.1 5'-methylthioadenosine phosphorylase [Arthrobacter bambusae]MDQ0234769.1 5'-methylthioadenosine phosphorylase [Arthrobacter bambusae]
MSLLPEDTAEPRSRIAIIGGTGLYRLPGAVVLDTLDIPTPFGPPSSAVTVARLAARDGLGSDDGDGGPVVAFLSRHGRGHSVSPQQINYRANLWALKSLGVEAVISSAAVGGLVSSHGTGTFAVPDQVLDKTWGRADTFYDGSSPTGVQHLPAAEPYSAALRAALISSLQRHGEDFAGAGTVAVINGPRFSTKAESAALVQAGAHLISMTQYPEPMLAAELNMHFAALAFVTDADTGHDGSEPVTAELVLGRLAGAQPRILAVLSDAVRTVSEEITGADPADDDVPWRMAPMPPAAVATVMGTAGPGGDGPVLPGTGRTAP